MNTGRINKAAALSLNGQSVMIAALTERLDGNF